MVAPSSCPLTHGTQQFCQPLATLLFAYPDLLIPISTIILHIYIVENYLSREVRFPFQNDPHVYIYDFPEITYVYSKIFQPTGLQNLSVFAHTVSIKNQFEFHINPVSRLSIFKSHSSNESSRNVNKIIFFITL